jgi:hypothetical protein
MMVEKPAKFWSPSPNSSNQNFSPSSTPIQNLTFTKMYSLNAVDSFQISGPKDIYIYDIVSVAGGLAAISSDDSLRLFDPLALSGAPLNSIRQVNTDVTCLKAINSSTEADALIVCTAGRDGKVCLLDPRSGARIGEVRTGGLLLDLSLSCAFAAVHFNSDLPDSLCLVSFLSSWFCFPAFRPSSAKWNTNTSCLPWSRLWNRTNEVF